MSSKILIKKILLAVIIVFIFFIVFLFYSVPVNSVQIKQTPILNKIIIAPKPEQTSFGLPIHLDIPKVNISADLEHVGLTSYGAMDVPQNQNNAAWLETGPRPGEQGNAIIDGHYGWKDGKPSAFDNLYKLRRGDKILVEDDAGITITFVVHEIKRYSPGANATAVFISNDEKSHLNLITCEGNWDEDAKSYSTRLVIFTDKEIK